MRASLLLGVALTLFSPAALAQSAIPPPSSDSTEVVVQGVRSRPSGWREAETAHVIVLSDGKQADLVRTARNLERLHFLLSGLLGRADRPDETIKLRVTLIGDLPEFEAMDLQNARWQQGPFNEAFSVSRYYDPREDGAVMAVTRVDQRIILDRESLFLRNRVLALLGSGGAQGAGDPAGQAALNMAALAMASERDLQTSFGENAATVTADSLLYAGFAQHFLTTYFPAAYPRWYVDGFGQVFSTLVFHGDDVLEYGRSPAGTSRILRTFGSYPIADVLSDKYLSGQPSRTRWTPIHAWMLTHFLFFSDTRRPQLRRYLALRANGADAASAAAVFGDLNVLARELRAYFGARKPYERVTYPPERTEEPIVRRLSEGEAAFVKGRLELGSRIQIPPLSAHETDAKRAATIRNAHDEALKDRDRWLGKLRVSAARYPQDLQAQLLLAEAECRSGNAAECLAAADRARTVAPRDSRPLTWKGLALVEQAVAAPEPGRAAGLRAARDLIAEANHLDLEAVGPLLAYHQSFASAREAVPINAVHALQKAGIEVPNAPATRLSLATVLADRGQAGAARLVILPVAAGAYDSPERPAASTLLARLPVPGIANLETH